MKCLISKWLLSISALSPSCETRILKILVARPIGQRAAGNLEIRRLVQKDA